MADVTGQTEIIGSGLNVLSNYLLLCSWR